MANRRIISWSSLTSSWAESREPSSWLLRPPNCEAERNRVTEKERARENRCNKRHGPKQWNRYESAEICKLHMVIYWKRSTRERMGSHIPDRKNTLHIAAVHAYIHICTEQSVHTERVESQQMNTAAIENANPNEKVHREKERKRMRAK